MGLMIQALQTVSIPFEQIIVQCWFALKRVIYKQYCETFIYTCAHMYM